LKPESIYALLLYAYPQEFRKRFGREMRQVFRDRWRAVSAAPGLTQHLHFFFEVARDWLGSSMKERLAVMKNMFPGDRLWRTARGLGVALVTVLVCLLISSAFLQAYVIPTQSMAGSLQPGDHILVNKIGQGGQIGRGDLVTFRYPEDRRMIFVKRVIGLPGDHLRLIDKQVIRNGRRLVEPYLEHVEPYLEPAQHSLQSADAYRDNFPAGPAANVTPRGRDMLDHNAVSGEIVVPAESFFVLGDNRDNSLDSRYWGFVARQDVIGKPMLVFWSYNAGQDERIGGLPRHFFAQTRWSRTLHLLSAAPPREVER
jgi:signal peptidase I